MSSIVVEVEVRVTAAKAFDVWTKHCGIWWPGSHTMSGSGRFKVVFEPWSGGRIFERSSEGVEHEWGEVIVWDPPGRLEYDWHIFLERSQATRVVVTFTDIEGGTLVRLENSGFEVFGKDAAERIPRVESSWSAIMTRYTGVFERSAEGR